METKIVLVHGLSIRFREISLEPGEQRFRLLIQEIFKSEEVKVIVPEYLERYKRGLFSIRKTIPEYAEVVQEIIEKDSDDESIILVGYSMGGLVCRYLVEKMEFPAKAVILVGTPNKGLKLRWWEKILQKVIRVPCVEDMIENSKFLRNFIGWEPLINYYIGARYDKRVSMFSSRPLNIRYTARSITIETGHSGLIPENKEGMNNTAIPSIIEILRREIEK